MHAEGTSHQDCAIKGNVSKIFWYLCVVVVVVAVVVKKGQRVPEYFLMFPRTCRLVFVICNTRLSSLDILRSPLH
jgi:hypothetical protein